MYIISGSECGLMIAKNVKKINQFDILVKISKLFF